MVLSERNRNISKEKKITEVIERHEEIPIEDFDTPEDDDALKEAIKAYREAEEREKNINDIDITFDFYSDTPKGKDPDSYSPTLRKFHKILWSKPLPNGETFNLTDKLPRILHHQSNLGEFFLSSDAVGHTYSKVKKMSHIIEKVPSNEINIFFSVCSTIGGYMIFPSKQVDRKMTINAARGLNRSIQDRFDLTLECIRRFYADEHSPLSDTLERYASFFNLFKDFKGYVDFFLLQDLVQENYLSIKYYLPFKDFDEPPLPKNLHEYQLYKNNTIAFINARNQRIKGLAQ